MQVALAAVKLAHEAMTVGGGDEDIPDVAAPRDRDQRPKERAGTGGMTRLWVSAGRAAGIRPGDLVGAIANEAGLSGRVIGAIEIADRFSLVEVPESSADQVVKALRNTTIKGRKATVRRDKVRS